MTTRRRSSAIAVAVLLAGVGIGVLAGGGEGDREPAALPLPAAPQGGAEVALEQIGVTLRRPPGWSLSRGGRELVFRSRDRAAVLSISSPPQAPSTAAALLKSALRAIGRSYSDVTARPGDGRRVAGLPTSGVVVSARNRRGVRLRVLVAAVQGRRRAWLVQVFATGGSSTARLVEAQVALQSLRLEG